MNDSEPVSFLLYPSVTQRRVTTVHAFLTHVFLITHASQVSLEDFDTLTAIGEGAFGKVLLEPSEPAVQKTQNPCQSPSPVRL